MLPFDNDYQHVRNTDLVWLVTYPNMLKHTLPFLYRLGLNRTWLSPVVMSFTRGALIG